MQRDSTSNSVWWRATVLVIWIVGIKIWLSILWEYRWYFPLNFLESSFLFGREQSFSKLYGFAFYLHITTSPVALALATYLYVSATRAIGKRHPQRWRLHRWLGRILTVMTLLMVAPSGAVIALQTMFGMPAALGFTAQAAAVAGMAASAGYCALKGHHQAHRRWATRTWIVLCGPLLFRLTSAIATLIGTQQDLTYQINAWSSWLVPWLAWEFLPRRDRSNSL